MPKQKKSPVQLVKLKVEFNNYQLLPADPNCECAMNCGRSSTGRHGKHKCSVCLK